MYMKKYILFILLSIIPYSYSQIFNLYNNMSVIEKNIIKKICYNIITHFGL